MRAQRWTVGIDFGGTNIKCGLVNARGRVRRSLVLSAARFGAPQAFLDGATEAIRALVNDEGLSLRRLVGVGVGAPGLIDVRRGLVHRLVNVRGWHHVPLADRLRRRLGVPVFVDNDVNVVALGEWRFGAGRGTRHLICLTLGTGVGGGLMFDGCLYRGHDGAAGELGHLVIDPTGRRCGCGRRGCLESLVGAAGIVALAREKLRHGTGPLTVLTRRARGRLSPRLVGQAARERDARAKAVWAEVGRRLGVALANLVNALNPERIVIGGGVANNWSLFYPALITTLRREAMAGPPRHVRVVRARLGDDAGIVGGAVLVWSESQGRRMR